MSTKNHRRTPLDACYYDCVDSPDATQREKRHCELLPLIEAFASHLQFDVSTQEGRNGFAGAMADLLEALENPRLQVEFDYKSFVQEHYRPALVELHLQGADQLLAFIGSHKCNEHGWSTGKITAMFCIWIVGLYMSGYEGG